MISPTLPQCPLLVKPILPICRILTPFLGTRQGTSARIRQRGPSSCVGLIRLQPADTVHEVTTDSDVDTIPALWKEPVPSLAIIKKGRAELDSSALPLVLPFSVPVEPVCCDLPSASTRQRACSIACRTGPSVAVSTACITGRLSEQPSPSRSRHARLCCRRGPCSGRPWRSWRRRSGCRRGHQCSPG